MKTVLLGALAALVVTVGVTEAQAYDRRVNIINNTYYDIREFYASNVGSRNWEEDILGRDILPAGYEVVVNIDDRSGYCKFDFRAVFEDGDEVITEGVNVCEVGEFTYND